ncbi:MAG: carbonic anhydrase [Alphaproteobacteria bacterium 40-19]|nr:MAG: carbonic anhydrase [Alphaproteobacteria bacterium 40-19]
MDRLERILSNNKIWAQQMINQDPDFFKSLVQVQRPEYLWIGCADSRVPANEIIGLKPGEVFVHRNIANIVSPADISVLSVIYYAVEILGIEEIIVTGHYGCGGVRAALMKQDFGLIEPWLSNIRELKNTYKDLLTGSVEEQERQLVVLNVKQQVLNVGRISVVQKAWALGKKLKVYGLVYNLEDGILNDLGVTLRGLSDVPEGLRILGS